MANPARQHVRRALWHAKAAVKCMRRAITLAGGDPDAPIIDNEPASGYADDPDLLPRTVCAAAICCIRSR
jgi:hypothetical protein